MIPERIIKNRIRHVLSRDLGISTNKIKPDTHFYDDSGLGRYGSLLLKKELEGLLNAKLSLDLFDHAITLEKTLSFIKVEMEFKH